MINQNELFNNLTDLANDPASGFYWTDQMFTDGRVYRIFNYRLSSYQFWIKPDALYGRGTVFDVTDTDKPVLVSLCMPKFFNLDENPMAVTTEELDTLAPDQYKVCNKADGSLITLFRNHNGELIVKSKGSLYSDQAIAARKYIEEQKSQNIMEFIDANCTPNSSVNMEWVAPDNLIVLRYNEAKLIPLNTVDHTTGKVTPFNVDIVHLSTVQEMKSRSNIEGVVVYLADGRMVKVKTDWYVALHRVRDDINNPKRIAASVLEEASDDMKSAFPEFKEHIEKIEYKVIGTWNRLQTVLPELDLTVKHELQLGTSFKDIALKCKDLSSEVAATQNLNSFDSFFFNYCMVVMRNKQFDNTKLKELVIDYCVKDDATSTLN